MVNGKNATQLALAGIQDDSFAMGFKGKQQSVQAQKDEALKKFLQTGELENKRLIADKDRASTEMHHRAMEDIGRMNANTNAGYRADQAIKMEEDAKAAKLKMLLGGGTMGVDGKPLSTEAQKAYNSVDVARDSLNKTEELAKKHPYQYAAEAVLPGPLAGYAAKIFGGPLKEIHDSKGSTKEAFQSIITGAAASGEQVPTFQSFSGPGALDAIRGEVKSSDSVRDNLNTLQQGYARKAKTMTPEMLEVSGLEDDEIAQYALEQQELAAQAKKQQALQKLQPNEQALLQEAQANPTHPNAKKVILDLTRKYGNIFQ